MKKINIAETAKLLKCTKMNVYLLIKKGKLIAFNSNPKMILEASVLEYKENKENFDTYLQVRFKKSTVQNLKKEAKKNKQSFSNFVRKKLEL